MNTFLSSPAGHEGRGSLLAWLKARVWALGCYAGNDETGFEHNSTHASMSVALELTDAGFQNVEKVGACRF